MKNSQKRTCCDISLIHQDEFHDFCKKWKAGLFYEKPKNAFDRFSVYNDYNFSESIKVSKYQAK